MNCASDAIREHSFSFTSFMIFAPSDAAGYTSPAPDRFCYPASIKCQAKIARHMHVEQDHAFARHDGEPEARNDHIRSY